MNNRKIVLLLLLLATAAVSHAVSFSAMSPSGHLISYTTNGTNATVVTQRNLTGNVVIPSTVTYEGTTYTVTAIADNAFSYYCSAITGCTLPNTIATIGWGAFGNTHITSMEIPPSVTSIGAYAFQGCPIASLRLPATDIAIGTAAFQWCDSLRAVYYGGTIEQWCGIHWNDESSNPLRNHAALYIDSQEVADLVIPGTVDSIGTYAFAGAAIRSLAIADGVTYIGEYAFTLCDSLRSANTGNTVTEIGNWAFISCHHLATIALGPATTSIGAQAFDYCERVDTIRCKAVAPPNWTIPYGNNIYLDTRTTVQLLVPCASAAAYRTAWSSITHIDGDPLLEVACLSACDTMGTAALLTLPTCSNPSAIVAATPAQGFRFCRWSNGETRNPYTAAIGSDTLFVAIFADTAAPDTLHHAVTLQVYDTLYVADCIHDTEYVANYIYDTIYDTSYVHDTTYISFPVHDTICLHDTLVRQGEIPYHTLTVTALQPAGIAVGSGSYSDGTIVQIAAIPLEGHHFLGWSDGTADNPRHVTVESDAAYGALFDTEGIGTPGPSPYLIFAHGRFVTVRGAQGQRIRIFDALGRLLHTEPAASDSHTFGLPAAGVYLIQVADRPAQRVVIAQ